MFSEWNILNVEGQRGQKLLTLKKPPVPWRSCILTNSGQGKGECQGWGNSWKRRVIGEGRRDAAKQESTGRYVLPAPDAFVCLVFARSRCLSCLSSAAEEVPTTTPRGLGPSRTWRQGCFQNHTASRFTWEWSFLSLQKKTAARSWKCQRLKTQASTGQ